MFTSVFYGFLAWQEFQKSARSAYMTTWLPLPLEQRVLLLIIEGCRCACACFPLAIAHMLSRSRLFLAPSILFITLFACKPIQALRTECGNDGQWCLNDGKCDPSANSCICNDSWINGPTFTGAQCEIATADCGHGIWCVENQGTCVYRSTQWAHGDGVKECEDGGGCKDRGGCGSEEGHGGG